MPRQMSSVVAACLVVVAIGCRSAKPPLAHDDVPAGYSQLEVPVGGHDVVGTIVVVPVDRVPIPFDVICTREESLGEIRPTIWNMADTSLERGLDRAIQLHANTVVEKVKVDVEFSDLASIVATRTNSKVDKLSDTQVVEGESARRAACMSAIERAKRNLRPNERITFVREALSADVEYTFKWKRKASSPASILALAKKLALSLGADASSATTSSAKGKSLYWAIRDDPELVPGLGSGAAGGAPAAMLNIAAGGSAGESSAGRERGAPAYVYIDDIRQDLRRFTGGQEVTGPVASELVARVESNIRALREIARRDEWNDLAQNMSRLEALVADLRRALANGTPSEIADAAEVALTAANRIAMRR